MSNTASLFFLSCWLAILQDVPVFAIWCSQCTPTDPACRSGYVQPQQCPENKTLCYTYNLYIIQGGGQGTYRGCAAAVSRASQGCHDVTILSREAVGCTYLCDWNNCNSSYGDGQERTNLLQRRRRRSRRSRLTDVLLTGRSS
ncbi:uncharacterized protein LOC101845339 [Aplysia californica]|uniref:Uncharacterized protein LOC101845339 n=1 Tax=Aplysia californica TaxID=6500 RepID=A0ABM0JU72_APLCA|nr:uncharacterized protein LOC101845339 [Aplysia californica]